MTTINNETVTLAHGAGGKQTAALIDRVFAKTFANPDFTADDAAVLANTPNSSCYNSLCRPEHRFLPATWTS